MFKRTKGYLLLTLLVLTGLAGRTHSDTMTAKERHTLLAELKASKQSLYQKSQPFLLPGKEKMKISGTSLEKQLYQTIYMERRLWQLAKSAMQQRLIRKDTATLHSSPLHLIQVSFHTTTYPACFKNPNEAFQEADMVYTEIIRYLRTTTENPKRYLLVIEKDTADVYETIQAITILSRMSPTELKKCRLSL